MIARCAVVAGVDSWEVVEAFGEAKADRLKTLTALSDGVPSHDPFYLALEPDAHSASVPC